MKKKRNYFNYYDQQLEYERKYLTIGIAILVPIFILMALVRYILGYRYIIVVDLIVILTFITLTISFIISDFNKLIFKINYGIFRVFLFSGFVLPILEYIDTRTTLYAEITYIIPLIIYIVFFVIFKKKVNEIYQ